jgi:hypothetical protein
MPGVIDYKMSKNISQSHDTLPLRDAGGWGAVYQGGALRCHPQTRPRNAHSPGDSR